MARTSVPDFQTANPLYAGSSVTFFTVDVNGVKTSTKASLFDSPIAGGALANPQVLDSDGKFAAPVYIEEAVIMSVAGVHVADHDTGVIAVPGTWRGDWVTATTYFPGDTVVDGANGDDTKDHYRVVSQHTSGVWATDKADSTKLVLALDVSTLTNPTLLPAVAGNGLKMIRVNSGATAYEVRTPAQVLSDIGAGTGSLDNIVEDTSPQLGGMLDVNGKALGDGALEILTFTEIGNAINEINVRNAAAGNAPALRALGGDTNIDLDLIGKGTGVVKSDGTAIGLTGKHTIFVPAAAMRPTVSAGCSALTLVVTAGDRPDLQVLDFITSADEHAQFQVAFPKSWNLGTVTFQVFWTSTATDTDGVTWGLQGLAVTDNVTINAVYGGPQVVSDFNQSAANELLVSDESPAITIGGTPIDDDLSFFRVFRDVSDSDDTAAEDARLIGLKFFLTLDTGNDA